MSTEDEFPDDFQGVNWDAIDIPALGEASTSPQVHLPSVSRLSSANSSTEYSCDDDEIDAAFLAEVDALEEMATQAATVGPSDGNILGSGLRNETTSTRSASSPRIQASRFFLDSGNDPPPSRAPHAPPVDHGTSTTSRSAQKRYAQSPPLPSPSRKKGKMQDNDDVGQILEEFEHEMICPICCDIFAAAHLGNPCGHTFCGECGLKWIINNRIPTCAICRSNLSAVTPMIPNFVVDNTIEKYIKALVLSGNTDWEPGCAKFVEWTARKEQWNQGAPERASRARPRAGPAFNPAPLLFSDDDGLEELPVWDDIDEMYEDELASAAERRRIGTWANTERRHGQAAARVRVWR